MSVKSYTQLAVWIERHEPVLFSQLVAKTQKLKALGDLYRAPPFYRREGQALGDYGDYFSDVASAISYTASDIDLSNISLDTFDTGSLEAELAEPSIADSVAAETAGAVETPISVNEDLGLPSDIANVNIPDVSASIPTMPNVSNPSASASTVGQALSSNAGLLVATLNAANTVLQANAASNLLQAQASRAAAGLAPANVSYVSTPSGVVPVLNTGSGQLPLTGSGINALAPSTFLQSYGLYIMLGLAGLVLVMEN